jgi:hypothetical protein
LCQLLALLHQFSHGNRLAGRQCAACRAFGRLGRALLNIHVFIAYASARITRSDENTTLRVEARPTPSASQLLAFLLFSIAFVWIYSRGLEAKPWLGQGPLYGVEMWLIASVSRYLIYFAVEPWSGTVIALQIGPELLQS